MQSTSCTCLNNLRVCTPRSHPRTRGPRTFPRKVLWGAAGRIPQFRFIRCPDSAGDGIVLDTLGAIARKHNVSFVEQGQIVVVGAEKTLSECEGFIGGWLVSLEYEEWEGICANPEEDAEKE